MIHEEKWYTCDRCGERIENLVEDVLDCLPEEVSAQIPRDDYLKIMSGESDISIVNAEFDGKDTETVTIRKVFLQRGRKIFCVYGKNSSLIRNRYV